MSNDFHLKSPERVKRYIKELGGEVISLQCKRHWKVVCKFGEKVVKLTLPITASDHRAELNFISQLRKKLKS